MGSEYLVNTLLGDFSGSQLDTMGVWDFFNQDFDDDVFCRMCHVDNGDPHHRSCCVYSRYLYDLVVELFKVGGAKYEGALVVPNPIVDGYLKYMFGTREPSEVLPMVVSHLRSAFFLSDVTKFSIPRYGESGELPTVVEGVSDALFSELKLSLSNDKVIRLGITFAQRRADAERYTGAKSYTYAERRVAASGFFIDHIPSLPNGIAVDTPKVLENSLPAMLATLRGLGFGVGKIGVVNLSIGTSVIIDKDFLLVLSNFKSAYGFDRVVIFAQTGFTVFAEGDFLDACVMANIYFCGSQPRVISYDADSTVSDVKVALATGGSYALFNSDLINKLSFPEPPLRRIRGIGRLFGRTEFEEHFEGWGIGDIRAYNRRLESLRFRERLFMEDVKGLVAVEFTTMPGPIGLADIPVVLIPGVGVYRRADDYFVFATEVLAVRIDPTNTTSTTKESFGAISDKTSTGGEYYLWCRDDKWSRIDKSHAGVGVDIPVFKVSDNGSVEWRYFHLIVNLDYDSEVVVL